MRPRILIVEDERLVARELEIRVARLGHLVTGNAASADDALRLASERTPDLALMDVRIRGPRDGIETATILRQQFGVPVIFLTAHGDRATVERARVVEPLGYLLKPLKEGELEVVLEVALDRLRALKQTRDREQRLASTLRSLGDAVITTDTDGRITFLNPAAEQLAGATTDQARGRPLADVMPPGRAGVVDSPILDDHGHRLGAVVVIRDPALQRELDRELASAERLASLRTLGAGIAHEINNPLTWIMTALEWSREQLATAPAPDVLARTRADLDDALGGLRRIQRIVAELSVFSRPPTGAKLAHVDDALALALRELGVAVVVELPALPAVAIEAARLTQVLGHLLANARDATAGLAPAGDPPIAVRGRVDGPRVILEVSDRGSGMSADVQARIFEPFFTTKPTGAGAGLGLAVCHGIVGAAGGTIEVTSAVGAGTTVTVALPRVRGEPVSESAPPPEAPAAVRILVIDDEEMIRRTLVRTLRGHDVIAGDATTALERLEQGERFDLILCDLMMPDFDGMQVFERVSALVLAQADRMLFVTAGAFSEPTARFLATMEHRVIAKPFSPATVRAAIDQHLAAFGGDRPA